jgi:hypothetical protein
MKRIICAIACVAAAAVVTGTAIAADPVTPFPANKVADVFVAAQTVTPDGAMSSWFAPGDTVVFRAYAVNPLTKLPVTTKEVRYFYVTIPGQPNVKLKYGASAPGASNGLPWTGQWVVPKDFAQGTVAFKVLIQIKAKSGKQLRGQFVQMPVATAMLTVSSSAPAIYAPAAPAGPAGSGSGTLDLALYVDSVNGTAPAGTQPRKIGCTQTNVYKRGERVVVRSWGTDLTTGNVLTVDNVKEAHISIPGQPDAQLAYSGHGATGAKVWFWSNFWIVPADFPLGEVTVHVAFTTENGKTGSYDYTLNIIP